MDEDLIRDLMRLDRVEFCELILETPSFSSFVFPHNLDIPILHRCIPIQEVWRIA